MVNGIHPIIKATNKIHLFIIFIPSIVCILSARYGTKMCTLGILAVRGVRTKPVCESLGNLKLKENHTKARAKQFSYRMFPVSSSAFGPWPGLKHIFSDCLLFPLYGDSLEFLCWVTISLPSHADTWRWVNVEKKTFNWFSSLQCVFLQSWKFPGFFLLLLLIGWIHS